MKTALNFLKATTLGGVFVLLPLVLLYLLLSEAVDLAILLATPIADLFPEGTFDTESSPLLLAILLIFGAAFLAGLLMLSPPARQLGHWIERTMLIPVPGYRAIKSLTRSLGGSAEADGFKPTLVLAGNGQREIGYVIEDHEDGNTTVLFPWSPTPMAGSIRIVPKDQLQPLPASLADVTQVLSHWGIGTRDLLRKG